LVWVACLCSLFSQLSLAEPSKDTVEAQLKAAVEDAQKKLPNLEPWQKVIFTEEVVPQFQRFIQDYRPSNDGLKVIIDFDSLKHYLIFYGPKLIKQSSPKLLVLLKSDPSCPKCSESVGAITRLVKSRIERRGLVPVWVGTEELRPHMTEKEEEDQVLAMVKKKNATGAMIVRWSTAPVDDLDTAHADEKRYIIHTFLQLGDFSVQNRQKELLDNDTFEGSEARLLTDIFADIGAKYELEQAIQPESGKQEVLIEITGIKDFAQYTRVKNLMTTQLKDITSLEDRKLSRDQVVFAVFTKRTSEELKSQLSQMNLDPASPQPLTVEVR